MADSDDLGPVEGDTGATGRAPRPPRQSDQEFDELDTSFTDETPEYSAFFEEESAAEPEPARRTPVEDFGFDEIDTDDESAAAGRSRARSSRGSSRRGSSSRGRARGAVPGRSRTSRGSSRGGGGGRGGAPASPLQSPIARIALGAVFVIILIAVIAFVVRDCRRDALVDSYKTYVNAASQVADDSSAQGQQLLVVLQNKEGRNATELQAQVRQLANEADAIVQRGEDLSPPGGLSDADRDLQTTLRYRANGLRAMADGLPGVIRADNQRFAARSIADSMKRFVASDVIYKDSFADVVAAKVRDEGIAGLEVATDALFLTGANDRYASEAGARTLLTALKRGGGSSSGTTGSGNLRGTSLVGVVASPSNTTLSTDTVTTIPASQSLEWAVTVRNGGDFVENGITVTATLRYPSSGSDAADTQEVTIETIDPGKEATVKIPGPPSDAWQPGQEGSLEIDVAPVSGETNTDNNRAEYPVTITVG